MNTQFKPEGYNSVSPYFVVDGAQKLIDLLKEVINSEQLRRYDLADGKIMHSEFRLDDSIIMIADSNDNYPPNNLLLHIYVENVHSTYNKALEVGFESIKEPTRAGDDPDVRGMVKDFQGNVWAIGTQIKN